MSEFTKGALAGLVIAALAHAASHALFFERTDRELFDLVIESAYLEGSVCAYKNIAHAAEYRTDSIVPCDCDISDIQDTLYQYVK